MKQALHIFRKDLRHLWPYIYIVLLLMAANVLVEIRAWTGPAANSLFSTLGLVTMLLPLSIALLVALLVFQEALPGDRQFWLSRPYDWKALLASKLLLVVLTINIPLFVCDCVILGAQGFPVVSVLPRLLLRQAILFSLFVLPPLALATLATGLTQFVLVSRPRNK